LFAGAFPNREAVVLFRVSRMSIQLFWRFSLWVPLLFGNSYLAMPAAAEFPFAIYLILIGVVACGRIF
jgi:hypothetical protein